MNEGPSDPAQPSGPEPASKPPGSRFEDLSDFEVPVDAVATGARTPTLITAAVVLFAGALFAVLYLVLLLPSRRRIGDRRFQGSSSASCSSTGSSKR